MELPELSAIHDQFLLLSQIGRDHWRGSLGGKLLLGSALDPDGIAVLLAASIAGAASLYVDSEADRLREGLRAGFVDFVVGTLDEALRILKNEIRRARAVAVALTANPQSCIAAMIERGLQPDLLAAMPQAQPGIFLECVAVAVPATATAHPGTLVAWSVGEDPIRAMQRLSELAQASLDPQRADTMARRRWLVHSSRYLGRAFATRQCVRMAAAEIADFLQHARAEFTTANITLDGEAD